MLGRAAKGRGGLSPAAGRVIAHLLSLVRPVLGATILVVLAAGPHDSGVVLSATIAACLSDWLDGLVARWSGAEGEVGRLLDGLCDAGFLAFALTGMAIARVWSGWSDAPGAPPGLRALDALPLAALAISFGVYLARVLLQRRRGQDPVRSPRGHLAGIANYGLVLVGAAELLPGLALPQRVLQLACVGVSVLNLGAVGENLVLMFPPAAPGPTMRA